MPYFGNRPSYLCRKNIDMAEIFTFNPDYENGHQHFFGLQNDDDVLAKSAEIVSELLNKWNTSVAFISLTCRGEALRALVNNESAVAKLFTVDQKNQTPSVILRKARGMVNRQFVRAIVIEGVPINPQSVDLWWDSFRGWKTTHEIIIGVVDDD